MNYYEHHLGDYAAATGHLSWDEDMAYTRLLRAYYHHERAIPDGQQYRLARAATPAQRKAVDVVLAEFFELREGHWHQGRADREIERVKDKQAKARRSAEARWANGTLQTERNANASPDAMRTHMRTHCEGNAPNHQTPDTKHQTPEIQSPPKAAPARKRARTSPLGCLDVDALAAAGVDPQHAADWLAVRRAKALPLTATAWADTQAEAAKAGVTAAEAVRMAAAHGWGGFRASWLAGADARQGASAPRPGSNAAEAAKWVKHLGLDRPRSAEIIDMEAINAARPALG